MKNSTSAPGNERITNPWRRVIVCVLILLVGFNLRSVILAVPPILPLIKHDLGLSYTATGFLTALPVLMLGIVALPSGLIIERIGERWAVAIGLLLLGAGAILRALWPTAFSLFLFTLVLSLGIPLAQTAIPVLARRWFPTQIGFVTALFSDGLIIGEAVAAGVTVPVMLEFLGKDAWAASFILWGVPVLALVVLWLLLAPTVHVTRRLSVLPTEVAAVPAPAISNQSGREETKVNALHLGIMVGSGSLIYFGMNGWIASYNLAIHHADLTPLALAILNTAQLPVSLGVTLVAQRIAGHRWPFIAAGAICGIAIAGWLLTPAALESFWAALLGGSSALVFTLGIALPPLLASPTKVARLTGTTLSLTYCVAFIGPFLGGELWDLFHLPALAFVPVMIASALLIILGSLLPSRASFGFTVEDQQKGENERERAVKARFYQE